MEQILLVFNTILALIIVHFRDLLAKRFNLIDTPFQSRKTHLVPIPTIGGLVIFSFFLLSSLEASWIYGFLFENLTVVLFSFLIFLIGIADDVVEINYLKKFLFLIFVLFFFLTADNSFVIQTVHFTSLNKSIDLNFVFAFTLTIFFYIMLINAFNLIDGYNGVALSVSLICIINYLVAYNPNQPEVFVLANLIACFATLLLFNLKNKLFIGNSGAYLIPFILGSFAINFYNKSLVLGDYPEVEKTFIMFMLPGIDMLRVFLQRIMSKKNPFHADRIHFHHYLEGLFNKRYIFLIYSLIVSVPIVLDYFNLVNKIINISLFVIIYGLIIYKLKPNNSKI
jgi:UDP-GlcNAc:undecaprenyl-phosphate/decaprenyl-phosphate GlcNAc-1-phosphate transferase